MKLTTINKIMSNFTYNIMLKHLRISLIKKVIVSNKKNIILTVTIISNLILLVLLIVLVGLVLLIIAINLILDNPGLLAIEDFPILSFEEIMASHGNRAFLKGSAFGNLLLGQETNNITAKPCVFNPFIDLFHKYNSTYKYFPSYFINDPFNILLNKSNYAIDEVALISYKNYNQYFILEYRNNSYYYLVSDLYDIVSDYIQSNKNHNDSY
jgi:hypothetical protein